MFIIDHKNLIKTKVILAKHYHIQPSEIDKMQYWEYENFLLCVNEDAKEENKKVEDEKSKIGGLNPNSITKSMNKNTNSMMPKMPSMPNINISTPKI